MNLTRLRKTMLAAGVRNLYAKRLSANDNSKNQIYFKQDVSVLNLMPLGRFQRDTDNPKILKAAVELRWVDDEGTFTEAPGAQIIFYPQYPEIRMSGFLRGGRGAHNALMRQRLPGRILMLGVTDGRTVIAHVSAPDSQIAHEFSGLRNPKRVGVFTEVPLSRHDPRRLLIDAIRGVVQDEWINSQRLDGAGQTLDCNSPNCGGYTLEARLGVRPNGVSAPDFSGWELKAHSVPSLHGPGAGGAITLLTPEPTGGFYKTSGAAAFIRRYGYEDPVRPDRLNFSGRHAVGIVAAKSGLTLKLEGFDVVRGQLTDPAAGIVLADRDGHVAAAWKYVDLLTHWNRKHAYAAYVPVVHRTQPRNQYRYGRNVRLGEGTDFILLLKAFAAGNVYYDPGLKIEAASSERPLVKRRSQFRISSRQIGSIYHALSTVDVLS